MGKSEIVSIPIERTDSSKLCLPESIGSYSIKINEQQRSPTMNNHGSDDNMNLPDDVEVMANQVAGHGSDGKSISMLKCKDRILKPIVKKECGEREVYFYKTLEGTVDSTFLELRELVPKCYGTRMVSINATDVECIVLDDVTSHMKEPCVMDIKIGRRTWGPDSSYKKIMSEQMKFYECKRDLNFCIPGFQVHRISSNEFLKFGKDFGKSLNRDTAEDAIRTFLNADSGICRSLIVQFLAGLWRIQHWVRNQRRLRLYASSILLVYDARRLRECLKRKAPINMPVKLLRKNSLYRPMSLAVLNGTPEKIPTGFSGQLTKEGPILRPPTSPNKVLCFDAAPNFVNYNNTWQKSIRSLKRTHSFQNNYDKDVQNQKQDYTYILDELCSEQQPSELWASVKMIDFAHVYPTENCDVDRNYLEGIENLVRLFEDFLIESE